MSRLFSDWALSDNEDEGGLARSLEEMLRKFDGSVDNERGRVQSRAASSFMMMPIRSRKGTDSKGPPLTLSPYEVYLLTPMNLCAYTSIVRRRKRLLCS